MSAPVTRAHREAAHLALYGVERDMRPGAPGAGSLVSRWIETGDPIERPGKHSVHQAMAQMLADFEQCGRAAERADVVALVELILGTVGGSEDAEFWLRRLERMIEGGEHVRSGK